jgi:hypothetical protein
VLPHQEKRSAGRSRQSSYTFKRRLLHGRGNGSKSSSFEIRKAYSIGRAASIFVKQAHARLNGLRDARKSLLNQLALFHRISR